MGERVIDGLVNNLDLTDDSRTGNDPSRPWADVTDPHPVDPKGR